jgi:TonB family protein
MSAKFLVSLIFLIVLSFTVNAQRSLGIVNGRATYLPKPDYPREAKDSCASGKVEIEVLINENGDVLEAEAVSGDELLRAAAVEAVKKAKFSPTPEIAVKTKGIVVYNFFPEKKCLDAGVVNKKALRLPKPYVNPNLKISREKIIRVEIVVDESGAVVSSRVVGRLHPLLRAAFENAARQAKFPATLDAGRIRVRAYLVYKLKANGKVET